MAGGFSPIEKLGGTSRVITLLTFFIHFLHPLFCVANYVHWVMYQKPRLGTAIVDAYLAFIIIASFIYIVVVSVFYMWAWRFPEPEEISKRRRIYGVIVNLLLSDIPLFVIETKIVWEVQFADGLQGTSYVITCLSLAYSALRVWTFFMVKLIKIRAPVVSTQSHFAGLRSYPGAGTGMTPSNQHTYGQREHFGDYPPQEMAGTGRGGYPANDDYALRGYSPESVGPFYTGEGGNQYNPSAFRNSGAGEYPPQGRYAGGSMGSTFRRSYDRGDYGQSSGGPPNRI